MDKPSIMQAAKFPVALIISSFHTNTIEQLPFMRKPLHWARCDSEGRNAVAEKAAKCF